MSGFRLTPRAVASLTEIFAWTLARFGEAQAEAYRDALMARCRALAAGKPPHGRSCATLLGDEPAAQGLSYVREGAHFLVFRRAVEGLIVIDVVHERRDLPALIARLAPREDPRS